MTRIVVGVDGSEHSRRALRRAVEEAELRGGTVEAIFVYRPLRRSLADDLIGLPYGRNVSLEPISPDEPAHHPPDPAEEAQRRAVDNLKRFAGEALAGMSGPTPRLVAIPAEHAADTLIDRSVSADLLVIGTRGLGGFAGLLVGSVAHRCIEHARCPLLILPPAE